MRMKEKILYMFLVISFVCEAFPLIPNIDFLAQSSEGFADIADKAMPATVFIKAQVVSSEIETFPFLDTSKDDFVRRFLEDSPFSQQFPQQSQLPVAKGSGFLITSDGYIVTNHHVVKSSSQITVTLNDGREYAAEVVGVDLQTDLAVLKIDAVELPYLTFGNSDLLKVGEWVVAVGHPCGVKATLTVGVVSAKERQGMGLTSYEDFIQTDTAIHRGNSGGPLLNLKNEVVGINTALFSYGDSYVGIGLAIPSNMVENITHQLIHGGNIQSDEEESATENLQKLGLELENLTSSIANQLEIDSTVEGVVVSKVKPGSPAAISGIQPSFLITGVVFNLNQQTKVRNISEFEDAIKEISDRKHVILIVRYQNHHKYHLLKL